MGLSLKLELFLSTEDFRMDFFRSNTGFIFERVSCADTTSKGRRSEKRMPTLKSEKIPKARICLMQLLPVMGKSINQLRRLKRCRQLCFKRLNRASHILFFLPFSARKKAQPSGGHKGDIKQNPLRQIRKQLLIQIPTHFNFKKLTCPLLTKPCLAAMMSATASPSGMWTANSFE